MLCFSQCQYQVLSAEWSMQTRTCVVKPLLTASLHYDLRGCTWSLGRRQKTNMHRMHPRYSVFASYEGWPPTAGSWAEPRSTHCLLVYPFYLCSASVFFECHLVCMCRALTGGVVQIAVLFRRPDKMVPPLRKRRYILPVCLRSFFRRRSCRSPFLNRG